ncbi:hypothetical protein COEX109129_42505 [Corallococcus exiguus]
MVKSPMSRAKMLGPPFITASRAPPPPASNCLMPAMASSPVATTTMAQNVSSVRGAGWRKQASAKPTHMTATSMTS